MILSVPPSPTKVLYDVLCRKFKIPLAEVRRTMNVEILLSMRDCPFHLTHTKTIGNMVLFVGPLGKCFGCRWTGIKYISQRICEFGNIRTAVIVILYIFRLGCSGIA